MLKKVLILLFMLGCSQETASTTIQNNSFNFDVIQDTDVINKDIKDTTDTTNDVTEDDSNIATNDTENDVENPQDTEVTEDSQEDIEEIAESCIDDDGDNYGTNCEFGEDCDDTNPNFTVECPDCSKGNVVGCSCKTKSATCYSYDPITLGKGSCKKGVQLCTNGFWQECKGDIGPSVEVCNSKDDDCDGDIDEGVKSTCGNCDLTCNQQTIGGLNPWNLNSENSTGLGLDPQGNVTLDVSKIALNLKFIWIANSPQNTVSKVDCKTITEVGRYNVCVDPSRTSVDLEGNVWVACRGDGQIAKIIADKSKCIDKNGNGIIETSTNSNPIGNDECIKFIVQPNKGTYARGAAVDKDNNVWIGFWYTKALVRLNQNSGAIMSDIDLGCEPYGLVIDQKGIIWGQGAGCNSLIMVDPITGIVTKSNTLPSLSYPAGAYGLNVDKYGRIWVASGNSASVYDPKTLQWKVVNMQWGGGRGVASSNDGYVYVAVDGSGGAVKINGNMEPPQVEGFISSSGNPVGVALDYDGFVWVVNQGGSSAAKLDPKTMTKVGLVSVGSSPYTYSDMTGYTLNYFTAPKGQYSTVFFGGITSNPVTTNQPKQVWQSISAEADLPAGTALRFRLRAGNTKVELESAKWSEPIDFPPEVFPYDLTKVNIVGNLLQVEIQLTTKDKKVAPTLKSITAKSKLI
jgi:streptogramin lyase